MPTATTLRRTVGLIAFVCLAPLAAACGSSSPASSTAAGANSPGSGAATAFKFSACIRNHGVTDFPDPVVHSNGQGTQITIRITPSLTQSPAWNSAQQACRGILPAPKNGGTQESVGPGKQALLELARCVRSHRYPRFPDPDAQGQLTRGMVTAAGIDMQAPGFLRTAESCASVTHGQVTAAMVAGAVNGGGQ
jgi:hypothetical protein